MTPEAVFVSDGLRNRASIHSGESRILKALISMAEERIQRRLAAILAADVVGYSRLMERNEASTLAALKVRRKDVLEPVVARHGTHIQGNR
jgi:adenylate cyclase